MAALTPYLTDYDCASWWKKWRQDDAAELNESPYLYIVAFSNHICHSYGFNGRIRRAIRNQLCGALLLGRPGHAA